MRPIPRGFGDAVRRALDLLYPTRCAACGTFGTVLCSGCASRQESAIGKDRCPNCAAAWANPDNCTRCLAWDALDGASAAFEMTGVARRVVHGLKYRRVQALAPIMAAHIAPLADLRTFDLAFAVPLHSSRLRDRGFNQSELLLRELGWPQATGLRRVRKTKSQVGQGIRERRRNVGDAFAYDGPTLTGLTVAVLDDVITTGATVNECARVLREAGATSVVAVAYARASYTPDDPSTLRHA